MVLIWNLLFWDKIPEICKNANSLKVFKEKIKKWIPEQCCCRTFKKYIDDLGFCNIADSI